MNLANIKKHTWYRQETEGTPYFIYNPCCGALYSFKSPDEIFWYCEPEYAKVYMSKEILRREAEKMLVKEKKSPGQFKKLFAIWQNSIVKPNEKIYASIKNLEKLSNKQLLALNKKLAQRCFDMWGFFYIDVYDLDTEGLVERELVEEGITLDDETRNTLMMQQDLIVHQQAELSLIKIAQLIKKTPGALNTLSYISSPANLHRLETYPKILKSLEKHQQEFFWISNSWAHSKIMTVFDFVEELKSILSSSRNINQEVKDLDNFVKNLKTKKASLAKKHKFSPWLKQMFDFFGLLAYWRDQRKKQIQRMNHYLEALGREIARRSNLSWEEVKLVNPLEVNEFPVSKTLIKKYKKLLKDQPVIVYKGKKHAHLSKADAKKVVKTIDGIIESEVSEIRGMIACPGKVTGKVNIINKLSDFDKMKPGDVLVTVMTRPEYVPLMKMASAIVTDEGGITSHAAVVSRELKVPCIIGTQLATKKLKTGDTVFVNADHGVVQVKNYTTL